MIKKGDYITRKSYGNDTVFLVLNVRGDTVYLKGVYARLYADSPIDDCVSVDKSVIEDDFRPANFIDEVKNGDRSNFFYLPARILHLDGDSEAKAQEASPHLVYSPVCHRGHYSENGLRAAVPPDNDATGRVPIRQFPNPPDSIPLRNRFAHAL